MLKRVQDVYRTDQRNPGLAPCSCRRSRKPSAALDGSKGSILCAVMGGDRAEPARVAFGVAKLFRLLLNYTFVLRNGGKSLLSFLRPVLLMQHIHS